MSTSDSTLSRTFVYFISAGSGPIKIGLSDNPEQRLLDFQTSHYKKLHLLFVIECTTRTEAYQLESAFHRWYADIRLMNEWFDVAPSQIAEDVKLLMALAKSAIEIKQITSTASLARLEARAEKRKADKQEMAVQIRNEGGILVGYTCPGCGKQLSISGWSRHKKSCREYQQIELTEFSTNGHAKGGD